MSTPFPCFEEHAVPPNETSRLQMQNALRSAAEATETTHDLMLRFFNMQLELTVARIGCDIGLFRILSESEEPLSVDTVAERTGAAPSLLRRLLRYLASMRQVTETSKDHFKGNQATNSLANPTIQDCIYYIFNIGGPVYQALPETLKENQYNDSSGILAWHRGFNTRLDFFPWAKQHPDHLKWFQSLMSVPREGDWLDVFSVPSLAQSFATDQVLFVDVGGNLGHQSARLRSRYPDLPGRIIVQDLPETIQNAPVVDGVELMAHNFFEPQPIIGAKVYYLRTVLHDWDDEKALVILGRLVPAMNAESLILIDDMAVPDTGAHWWSACLDLHMLAVLGAHERTESQWRELLVQAGLRLISIRPYHPTMRHSIIVGSLP
ncbi:OmtB [Penicillium canariense]|uniref:OmtB n=1 Tax=Penicillium canariense TaxID=189055 RepID=A0A9W9LVM1_9EURO|nr:OmtB [Penicillium canariense]KAJ5177092.1 OmtB [Penicillium canariense]